MKTIALIEIGNDGHRETYMRYFIEALISLNCRVICCIPDPDPIRLWIEDQFPGQRDQVAFLVLPFFRQRFPLAGKWQERLNTWYNWKHVDQQLSQAESVLGWKTDLVFFNYLDPYLISYTPHPLSGLLMPRRWSGLFCFPAPLRLQPGLLKQKTGIQDLDYMLSTPECLAIALHDEDILPDLSKRAGKPVIYFPEIADLSAPDPEEPLARKIREMAGDRIVLGNIGLEKHKGNYELMRLAQLADPDAYFFVFTGRDDGTLFDFLEPEQTDEFRYFIDHLPENCLWVPAHFRDEAAYNAVLNAFDILFMLYTHFYGSSNRLTKAVHFGKPVLAHAAYCIGSTVRQFDLGEVVTDTRAETLLEALFRLKQRIGDRQFPGPAWPEYLRQNSRDALRLRFSGLLELL